jgi:hypothetical protein
MLLTVREAPPTRSLHPKCGTKAPMRRGLLLPINYLVNRSIFQSGDVVSSTVAEFGQVTLDVLSLT